MTPEQIAQQVDIYRGLEVVTDPPYPDARALVALADLVEAHLHAIRAFNDQQKNGQDPDAETLARLDATEIALSKAVKR